MINFRPHTRQDLPLRVKWINNPKANLFAIDQERLPTDIVKESKWFNNYENIQAKKFFTICDNEKPIGFMGLTNIDNTKKTAKIFILIGEDEYRGKGIGKISQKYLIDYAFDTLDLKSLSLEVNKQNIPAIKLNQSLNFVTVDENEKWYKMVLRNGKK